MPTDYQKIKEENIRGYGEWTHHLEFLGQLYTDRTHFIFELLQNAEDAQASKILFNLYEDKLEVQHDGRRFSEKDVRGVCGVGKGTKAEDLTKIGKFGIGFKSVYAHTRSPEIHSGEEHFKIESYIRPSSIPSKPLEKPWTTLFVFPFNSEEITPQESYKLIEEKLITLNARTLLFLRNIMEIEYTIQNSSSGLYLREENSQGFARNVSVIGQNNEKNEYEEWLLFDREVNYENTPLRVAISFLLEKEDNEEIITKVTETPLYVYFPTEKDTRLGFLIQGPFRTTPARDNVPNDNELNKLLIYEVTKLIHDAILEIKKLGLVSLSFFETLPIRIKDFPDEGMFAPIVDSVQNILINEEILPADDGTLISAKNAKLSRGNELINLLNENQLQQLFVSSNELKWLSRKITWDRKSDLRSYLIDELEIDEITPEVFARNLTTDFLSNQVDHWFIKFYRFLGTHKALWRKQKSRYETRGILRAKSIIRLSDNSQVSPFKDDGETPNAYLPTHKSTIYPIVSKIIVEDENAYSFLKDLGLSEPDIFNEIIDDILPNYCSNSGITVSNEKHISDIRTIANFLLGSYPVYKQRKVIERVNELKCIKSRNGLGEKSFNSPIDIYLPTPDLKFYFSNSSSIWFLDDYSKIDEINDDFWLRLGVAKLPRRMVNSNELPDKKDHENFTRYHKYYDYDLDGLKEILDAIEADPILEQRNAYSTVLWRFLHNHLNNDQHFFKSRYSWFYKIDRQKYLVSNFLNQLRSSRWIPTKVGVFQKPKNVKFNQLLDEFKDSKELIRELGIEIDQEFENLISEIRKLTGQNIESDELNLLVNNRGVFQYLLKNPNRLKEIHNQTNTNHFDNPEFPIRVLNNQENRVSKLRKKYSKLPGKEYVNKIRSVRNSGTSIDPKTQLRQLYKNEDGNMICQICKHEMPFRKKNGDHYFEKKEFLSRTLNTENETPYLALCPVCAAKYKEFIDKKTEKKIYELIKDADKNEIPINLESETSIRFVETHLHDLQLLIEIQEKSKPDST